MDAELPNAAIEAPTIEAPVNAGKTSRPPVAPDHQPSPPSLSFPDSTCTGDTRVAHLRALLAEHRRQTYANATGERRPVVSTGLANLDALLPEGGLPTGTVIELLWSDVGSGCLSLALWMARSAAQPRALFPSRSFHLAADRTGDDPHPCTHRPVMVLDARKDFYPPAAVRLGLHPRRLVVVQPATVRDGLWAVEQSLRCAAVGAVVAPLEGLSDGQARRLQLAAEQSGGVGLILKPARVAGRSFAALRMRVEQQRFEQQGFRAVCPTDTLGIKGLRKGEGRLDAPPQSLFSRRFRVTLVYVREGMPGGSCVVELPDEADFVRVSSGTGAGAADGDVRPASDRGSTSYRGPTGSQRAAG